MTIIANENTITLTAESKILSTPSTPDLVARDAAGLGPLLHCNVDAANYKLRSGGATREQAEYYCGIWNRPGYRMAEAYLKDYTIPFGEGRMTIPEIRLMGD